MVPMSPCWPVRLRPPASSGRLQARNVATGAGVMKLDCYRIHDQAPEILPARAQRDWMEEGGPSLAHRCTPMTMANSTGWEQAAETSLARQGATT
jgi:Family of unknown function (DUF6065)